MRRQAYSKERHGLRYGGAMEHFDSLLITFLKRNL